MWFMIAFVCFQSPHCVPWEADDIFKSLNFYESEQACRDSIRGNVATIARKPGDSVFADCWQVQQSTSLTLPLN